MGKNKDWLKSWHWGWKELDLFQQTGIISCMIILILVVAVAVWPVKEKFNPELHDCVERKGAEQTCIDYAPARTYGALDVGEPTIFNLTHSWCRFIGSKGFNAAEIVERECVSWQPKEEQRLFSHNYTLLNETHMLVDDYCVMPIERIAGMPIVAVDCSLQVGDGKGLASCREILSCESKLKVEEVYCLNNPSDSDKCSCLNKTEESYNMTISGSIKYDNFGWYSEIYWINKTVMERLSNNSNVKNHISVVYNPSYCVEAVPKELSFKEKCLAKEWNYGIIDASFGALVETCSFFNTTEKFTVYLYNSTR